MKPALLLVLVVSCRLYSQAWSRLPDFPGSKRDDGVGVVVGNKAYFGTGLQEGWSATIDWFALDLTNYTWTKIPDMPHTTERQYACAFPGPGCFFVFGGDGVGGALNNLYKYNIATTTWTLMAPKPGAGIVAASCMPFGDRVIITCGRLQAAGSVNREVWEYSISGNSWQQKNNIPFTGRWRASATTLHNYGYLLFGIDSIGVFKRELYRYDHNADTWTKVSDFPQARGRAYAAMQGTGEKLFVFGGYDSTNTFFNDVWYYNDIVGQWSQENALPSIVRKGGMSVAANDNFYYTCGYNSTVGRLNETWMTDVPLGVSKNKIPEQIDIFPVPARDVAYVNVPVQGDYTASLCDFSGRELKYFLLSEGGTQALDLRGVTSGVYVLKLFTNGNLAGTRKIIKEAE
jgi:N-acetylneuraminic acid mutarotase